jgi:hypothetical protein
MCTENGRAVFVTNTRYEDNHKKWWDGSDGEEVRYLSNILGSQQNIPKVLCRTGNHYMGTNELCPNKIILFLFSVCLITVSAVMAIQLWMIWWLVNNKMERMVNENNHGLIPKQENLTPVAACYGSTTILWPSKCVWFYASIYSSCSINVVVL